MTQVTQLTRPSTVLAAILPLVGGVIGGPTGVGVGVAALLVRLVATAPLGVVVAHAGGLAVLPVLQTFPMLGLFEAGCLALLLSEPGEAHNPTGQLHTALFAIGGTVIVWVGVRQLQDRLPTAALIVLGTALAAGYVLHRVSMSQRGYIEYE